MNSGAAQSDTMNGIIEVTPEYISRAVGEVRKLKPDYGLLLDLYEKIFIAQELAGKSVRLKEYVIPEEVLSVKTKEKFPLADISQFIIDKESSDSLFTRLCGILLEADGDIPAAAKSIIDAVDGRRLKTEDLYAAFLGTDDTFFDSAEREFIIGKKVLGFVVYNSIRPSLVAFSRMLEGYLDQGKEWDRGYCPVCGSAPDLSIFGDKGKRTLSCSFCGHEWASRRVYCPFCGNTDHETLTYYGIEDEEEYRVDVCEKCKKYIKTLDVKKTSRTVYIPLEKISTPYVDMRFEEMGYVSGGAAAGRK